MVSKETQLKVLSVVDDVKTEIKKMEEEIQEAERESIVDRVMFGKDNLNEQS